MIDNIIEEYIQAKSGKDYVGLKLNKSRLQIFFPIGYKINEASEISKKDIRKLFYLLAAQRAGYDEKTKDRENYFDLISAVNILNDYKKYGLYKESEKDVTINTKGKANWRKTISSNKVYLNNKIIYNKIYYNKTNYNAVKQIKDIQKICLRIISKVIGIYWNFYFSEYVEKKYSKSEMIEILSKEIKHVNQDMKIEILQNLLNFVKNIDFKKSEENNISLKYNEFEYIWQKLVDTDGIKGNLKKEYQPKAKYLYWNLSEYDGKNVNPSQPDTIYIDDNNKIIYVLDAKYYALNNLPNEYDIFKQTRYAEYVRKQNVKNAKKNKYKNYKIINAFVLPNEVKETVKIENFFAYSEDGGKNILLDNIIYIVYVDTKAMINNPKQTVEIIRKKLTRAEQKATKI